MEIRCRYFPQCPACQHWNTPYEEQKTSKISDLHSSLKLLYPDLNEKDILFSSLGHFGLRHRADFTVQSASTKNYFGFWKDRTELLQVDECLQFSNELQQVFVEFQEIKKLHKTPDFTAAVRLRISPSGSKSCWLDMAHVEFKQLLDDGHFLRALLAAGFYVEIGQRSKKLIETSERLKLGDPELHPWFQAPSSDGKPLALSCYVSDFTQPSWETGAELVKTVSDWVSTCNAKHVIEFGPGIGAFTLNLLSYGIKVTAFEIKKESVKALEFNAKKHNLFENLQIFCGDYQTKKTEFTEKCDLALVNPARSGLKGFTEEILQLAPRELIYVSCYPQSMLEDLKKLKNHYSLADAKIVDQFPQTQHYECALQLKLNK